MEVLAHLIIAHAVGMCGAAVLVNAAERHVGKTLPTDAWLVVVVLWEILAVTLLLRALNRVMNRK